MRPQLRTRMYDTLWKLECSLLRLVQDFFHQPWWHGWFWMHQKPYPPASANIVFSWKSVMSNRTGDHPSFHDAGRSSRNRVLLDFQVRNKGFKISHGHPISHKSLSPRLLRHLLPEISTSPPHCRCQVEHKHQKNKKHSYGCFPKRGYPKMDGL